MKAINRNSKIKILWKIWRGVNKISEDFNSQNTNLKVFLVGGCDAYAMVPVINREVEPGYDVIEIDVYPNTLAEGAYNLKALWTKNQGRDVLTSMRSGVFGITSNVEEADVKDEEVRLVSMVESYGRDGMSAFETAVLRGVNNGYTSEKEWADNFKVTEGIINNPDEEDITVVDDKLKLKDRQPSDGMGYVILRKNVPIKEQITLLNTIYEIRYDFDLGGEEVEIPENCVLKFEGGSLSNGTIIGTNTRFRAAKKTIFSSIDLKGKWVNNYLYPEWFGADVLKHDNAPYINACLKNCRKAHGFTEVKLSGNYKVSSPCIINSELISITGSAYKTTGGSSITANDDFQNAEIEIEKNGEKINKICYGIISTNRPIYINSVVFQCQGKADGIYWYDGWAGGTITNCGFSDSKNCAIVGDNVEGLIISDNYFYNFKVAVRFETAIYNPENTLVYHSMKENGSLSGVIAALWMRNNFIQHGGIGVLLFEPVELFMETNYFAHCQISAITVHKHHSLRIINNYFENCGGCQRFTLDSSSNENVDGYLIDNNLDGNQYDDAQYRSVISLLNSTGHYKRAVIDGNTFSYKKRGGITNCNDFSTERTANGIDCILYILNAEVEYNRQCYYDYNSSRIDKTDPYNELTIPAVIANIERDQGRNIIVKEDRVRFPIKFINYLRLGSRHLRLIDINTKDIDFERKFSAGESSMESAYNLGINDINIQLSRYINGIPFYKIKDSTNKTLLQMWIPKEILRSLTDFHSIGVYCDFTRTNDLAIPQMRLIRWKKEGGNTYQYSDGYYYNVAFNTPPKLIDNEIIRGYIVDVNYDKQDIANTSVASVMLSFEGTVNSECEFTLPSICIW